MQKLSSQSAFDSDGCHENECDSGLRNRYFEGKRLSVDSFRVEQKYLVERRQLLNRAIHGWGVVYGYRIDNVGGFLKIKPGLALDRCGRELLETDCVTIDAQDIAILDECGKIINCHEALAPDAQKDRYSSEQPERLCWLLSVHYAERKTARVLVQDSCRCEHDEWDHTCETVFYSLRRIKCSECHKNFECELDCDCNSAESGHTEGRENDSESKRSERGGHQCLCEHLAELDPGGECGCLKTVGDCGKRIKVDLSNGVALACVKLVELEGRCAFGKVESCGPRRLVKRNDLLFDLIRGCDLTRIIDFGWKEWHRKFPKQLLVDLLDVEHDSMPFDEFAAVLDPAGPGEAMYVMKNFNVKFSRQVRVDSLRPNCFAMNVISFEREGGWWQTLRVPIVRVDAYPEPELDSSLADGAIIAVEGSWLDDAVRGRASLFKNQSVIVELEMRGDFIMDCNGQPIDANSIGLIGVPSGNGSPGGTFLSTFIVAKRDSKGHWPSDYASEITKGAP
jgi:hypothetical protein